MSHEAVAKRYAQAIFELGVEASGLSALTEDIKKVAQVYAGSPELRSMIKNPLVAESARLAAMKEISERLALSPLAKNAIGLLTRRRRLDALPHIARELARLTDDRSGLVRATVTSATALSEAYCQRLQKELERMTGKKVLLERKQDPALLAGVVTRIGDRVIDGSARTRLAEIRAQLLSS